jgi:hypothetical protein
MADKNNQRAAELPLPPHPEMQELRFDGQHPEGRTTSSSATKTLTGCSCNGPPTPSADRAVCGEAWTSHCTAANRGILHW